MDTPHRKGADESELVGLLEDGAVWAQDGVIRWVGPQHAVPAEALNCSEQHHVEVALPAFVECHTHALFAGSRHDEFDVRNQGGSYAEILEAGGGILSTVAATRGADDTSLEADLDSRLAAFARSGCSVVEVKTGYGLSHGQELRHLAAIRRCASRAPVEVVVTYLGAHAVPAERRADRAAYIAEICDETIPAIAREGLAEAIDVFCDRGAFTADEARRILARGQELGLTARIHADELSHAGGCAVAAELGAASADHLEYAQSADLDALAGADVAGVLLPGVTVFLDADRRPPAREMAARGMRLALSTDYNPGSSHTMDLLLMATLGCALFKLTPGEALRGLTRVPAEILGRASRFGRLAPACDARVLTADLPSWRALPYHMAPSELLERVGFAH